MSDSNLRATARGLLAARRLLALEHQQLQQARRKGARRSRQQLRRKRAAERIASDVLAASGGVDGMRAHLADLSRRRLARLILDASTLPDLLSTREMADLELLISHRVKTGGRTGQASYWTDLGPAPDCDAGDTTRALLYHRRIQQTIDRGGWSKNERSALYALERRWRARADGTDARFMEVGTAGSGRLPRDLERKIKGRG